MSCWSDLNNDILEHITSFLPLPDHHRISAVCRHWRWVAKNKHTSPAKQLPWLVMRQDPSTKKRKFFSLTEKKEYCIDIPQLYGQRLCGSSFGWLSVVDCKFRILLLNPFTREHHELPEFPNFDEKKHPRRIIKVILSDDPSTTSDFTVLFLYWCSHKAVAFFWRPGDIAWTSINCMFWTIQDAIFFRGSLYAICFFNMIYTIELGSNPTAELVGPPSVSLKGAKYFVNFLGELLLVQRYLRKDRDDHYVTISFVAHKVNLEEKKFSRCRDLGDYAIFVGAGSPVVVDSRQLQGCKRNCIYFTNYFAKLSSDDYGLDDLGVYDMKERTIEPYYPPEIFHPLDAPPIWLTPNCNEL